MKEFKALMGYRREEDFLDAGPPVLERFAAAILAEVPVVKGVDLAPDWQHGEILSVKQMMDAGYLFAVVQATRGTWTHPNFLEFCKPLVDGGMPVMTYHLFDGRQLGDAQADAHLNAARELWELQGMRFPVFQDVEVRDGVAILTRQMRWNDFRVTVRKEVKTGTYSSYYLWQELMGNMALPEDHIGWLAAWSQWETFLVPVGWTREQIRFRQIGVALKHEWVPPVPGMKSDVDVNVFFGTMEELYEMGGSLPPLPDGGEEPPPIDIGDEDMATILEKIAEIKAVYPDAPVMINVNLTDATVAPPDDGEPEPPAVVTKTYTVTGDKAIAYYTDKNNNAGYPIMLMIPTDERTGQPFKNTTGQTVKVLPTKVNADGPIDFWEIYGVTRVGTGQKLYLPGDRGSVA